MVSVVNSMQESKGNAATINANKYIFKLYIENILFCSWVGTGTMCLRLYSNDLGHFFLANPEKSQGLLDKCPCKLIREWCLF